jgi:hypothetical protein
MYAEDGEISSLDHLHQQPRVPIAVAYCYFSTFYILSSLISLVSRDSRSSKYNKNIKDIIKYFSKDIKCTKRRPSIPFLFPRDNYIFECNKYVQEMIKYISISKSNIGCTKCYYNKHFRQVYKMPSFLEFRREKLGSPCSHYRTCLAHAYSHAKS